MDHWQDMIQMALKGVFFVAIPVFAVYFRVKKKMKTGFTVGIILTSFVLGILASASFHDDPLESFYGAINNATEDAKPALKIIIQYGPPMIEKIDEERIIYKDRYDGMKKELIKEYGEISARYYKTYTVDGDAECSDYMTQKINFGNLQHALQLITYSESIGGRHESLKADLELKIRDCEPRMRQLEKKCD
jgi:hypothetical protein